MRTTSTCRYCGVEIWCNVASEEWFDVATCEKLCDPSWTFTSQHRPVTS